VSDAASARGAVAYLTHLNARGGVRGRRIAYRLLDDGGDPARALEATTRLVERDGVFAIFGSVGSETGLAVREYLAGAGVPQVFVDSGALPLAGFRPSFRAEGWIYGSYLARTRPGAKVGVLVADATDGRELLAGLRQGVARTRTRVVATAPVDPAAPDVEPGVAALQAAGADVLALLAGPREVAAAYAAMAALGWRPPVVVAADAAGAPGTPADAVSIGWVKDPADPRWRGDAALRPYRAILRGRAEPHVRGMAAAFELARVLKLSGSEPTRAAVLAQLGRLQDAANPFLLPGVVVRTGAADRFPLEQAMLRRFSAGRWRSFGGVWRHAGR
jgi:branched-chain amino acid transport system substrate-binding protein